MYGIKDKPTSPRPERPKPMGKIHDGAGMPVKASSSDEIRLISDRIEIEFRWDITAEKPMKAFMLKDDVVLFDGGEDDVCTIASRHDLSFVVYPVEDYETLKKRLTIVEIVG